MTKSQTIFELSLEGNDQKRNFYTLVNLLEPNNVGGHYETKLSNEKFYRSTASCIK